MNIFDVGFKHSHNLLDNWIMLRLPGDEFQGCCDILFLFKRGDTLSSYTDTITILSHKRISGKC